MRLPRVSLDRRDVLYALAVSVALPATLAPKGALAAYPIVPIGTVAEKRAALVVVEKELKADPNDPYLFGEKAQLEYDIKTLARNREYVEKIAPEIAAGRAARLTSFRLGVPDMAAAVTFWTGGVGAQVLDTRLGPDGRNVTRIGYGPQTLRAEAGAKFALELVEAPRGGDLRPETSVVQYLQLGVPTLRLSQLMNSGGDVVSAYGWTEVVAPGGLPLRVRIDETRRDPFEFVALRTANVKATVRHYEAMGMQVVGVSDNKRSLQVQGSYGLKLAKADGDDDAFEPDRESGTVQLNYGDPSLSTGLLLLPPRKLKATLGLGEPAAELRVVGVPPASAASMAAGGTYPSPEGLRMPFDAAEAFERSLPSEALQAVVLSDAMAPERPSASDRFELL